MPNYKGHLAGGIAIYAAIIGVCTLHVKPCLTLLEWLSFTLLGALFPDIDTKSKGQKLFYTGIFIALIILFMQKKWYIASLVAPLALIPLLVNHRGIFHNLWFIILLAIIGIGISISLFPTAQNRIVCDALFFLGGAISHLALDRGMRKTLRLR